MTARVRCAAPAIAAGDDLPPVEHFGWCNPHQCFVVRPERQHPHRRIVRHRAMTRRPGFDIEAYLVTKQDPGAPVEVDEQGVMVLHLDFNGPADPFESGWPGVALAAMTAADNRAVTR